MARMRQCNVCKTLNAPIERFCINCKVSLTRAPLVDSDEVTEPNRSGLLNSGDSADLPDSGVREYSDLTILDTGSVEAPNAYVEFPWGRVDISSPFNVGRRLDFSEIAADLETYLTVSRVHAVISYREQNWVIEDMGSDNGTLINGVQVRPNSEGALCDGDRIHFSRRLSVVFRTEGQN